VLYISGSDSDSVHVIIDRHFFVLYISGSDSDSVHVIIDRHFFVLYISGSDSDSVHVIIDRHLITGQNDYSTLTAVQNLTLMCAQK
jgi:phenylpyruvate tautomerase PptA (4-oxalocrotonate tautomerase family)